MTEAAARTRLKYAWQLRGFADSILTGQPVLPWNDAEFMDAFERGLTGIRPDAAAIAAAEARGREAERRRWKTAAQRVADAEAKSSRETCQHAAERLRYLLFEYGDEVTE